MDIHRCRFVPYNPQAINALAFSHPPSTELSGRGFPTLRLAIGRANGDIELWNPLKGIWYQETILRGGRDRSIEGLAWTLDPSEKDYEGNESPGKLRLFSIGYSSVVTEWDLEQGRPARDSSGNYGEIWCLAAQPRWKSTHKGKDGRMLPPVEGEYTGQHLAVGCADGAIVILSTADDDLRYVRTMRPSTKKSRVLSIAFQDRNTIVAGYADSSIRIFDIRNGKLLRTVTLGKGPNKAVKELFVWSVKCLPGGTIVSGDSMGEIRFWDSENYSLVQRIQSHRADILDVAVSADGQSVVSVGADRQTSFYKLKAPEKGARNGRWVEAMHRRYHTHDVKALAVYETKEISVLVSGGLDTVPVVVPLKTHGNELHRKLPSLPQAPQLTSAPASRLLMGWWDREVNIWRVSHPTISEPQHRLAAKVLFQGEECLTSAALSPDGKILVAASISEIKAFSLATKENEDKFVLQVNKLQIPPEISECGAKEVAISPDCQWFCFVRPDNVICIAKIGNDDEIPDRPQILSPVRKLRRVQRHAQRAKVPHGTLGAYDRTVRCISFSANSNILAVGDISGLVDVWGLQNDSHPLTNGRSAHKPEQGSDQDSSDDESESEDIKGQNWVVRSDPPIPRLKTGILLMTFRPSTVSQSALSTDGNCSDEDDRLMILTAEHQLLEFHALEGKLTDWSRRNPKAYLPEKFTIIKDRAMGALWDRKNQRDRLWLYGPSWLWMFDLSQDFPAPIEVESEKAIPNTDKTNHESSRSKKRKRKDTQPNAGAGDRVPPSQEDIGLGRKMRKVIGDNGEKAEWIPIELRKPTDLSQLHDDEDAEQLDDAAGSALAIFRREKTDAEVSGNASRFKNPSSAPNGTNSAVEVVIYTQQEDKSHPKENKLQNQTHPPSSSTQTQQSSKPGKRRSGPHSWWYTFKYREIFGIVPLNRPRSSYPTQEEEETEALEVAVVERPMWDVPLPGRYVRDYE